MIPLAKDIIISPFYGYLYFKPSSVIWHLSAALEQTSKIKVQFLFQQVKYCNIYVAIIFILYKTVSCFFRCLIEIYINSTILHLKQVLRYKVVFGPLSVAFTPKQMDERSAIGQSDAVSDSSSLMRAAGALEIKKTAGSKSQVLTVLELKSLTLASVSDCWSAYRLCTWALLLIAHLQLQLKCGRSTPSDNQLFYGSKASEVFFFLDIFYSSVDQPWLWMNYKYFEICGQTHTPAVDPKNLAFLTL